MAIILDGTLGITTPGGDTSAVSYTTPIVKSPSSLTLQTNGTTTAVTIDTNQGVGLNGSVSSEWASSGILQINNSAAYSTLSLATTRSVSSGNRIGSIVFDMPNNTATYRSRAEIECDMIGSTANKFGAQFKFNTALDNATGLTTGLVVNPYGIGIGSSATPSSGTGIAFPATQSASTDPNTLDDYEEGTHTTTASVSSGSITLSDNTLYYTKIGSLVSIAGLITVSSVSSPGGNVWFSLPFTVATNVYQSGSVWISNVGATTGVFQLNVQSAQNIFYLQYVDTAGTNNGAAPKMQATCNMRISITFRTTA
jgi:hypothetical protein